MPNTSLVRQLEASCSRPMNGDSRPMNGDSRPMNGDASCSRPINGDARCGPNIVVGLAETQLIENYFSS